MGDKQETVADIVREMRKSMERVGCHFNDMVESWVNRIEVAHKREMAALAKASGESEVGK